MENKIDVSSKAFLSYEDVRASGVTNMWDVRTVQQLTGLSKETILLIIKNYEELKREYMPNE